MTFTITGYLSGILCGFFIYYILFKFLSDCTFTKYHKVNSKQRPGVYVKMIPNIPLHSYKQGVVCFKGKGIVYLAVLLVNLTPNKRKWKTYKKIKTCPIILVCAYWLIFLLLCKVSGDMQLAKIKVNKTVTNFSGINNCK